MMHVCREAKVCGITCLEDALLAVEFGADYLGFNFYRKSPRYVSPSVARAIIERTEDRGGARWVFVDEPAEEVLRLMENQWRSHGTAARSRGRSVLRNSGK
jgi:phosphoribosylanthranilate isomerase